MFFYITSPNGPKKLKTLCVELIEDHNITPSILGQNRSKMMGSKMLRKTLGAPNDSKLDKYEIVWLLVINDIQFLKSNFTGNVGGKKELLTSNLRVAGGLMKNRNFSIMISYDGVRSLG